MTDKEANKFLRWCRKETKQIGFVALRTNAIEALFNYIHDKNAEIERLRSVVDKTDAAYFQKVNEVDRAKAEAIKEALSRVETELGEYYIAKHLVVGTVLDKVRKEMAGDVG